MDTTNPADRLYNILSRAKAAKSPFVKSVWAEALHLSDKDLYQIFYHLLLLGKLLDEVELEVRLLPNLKHDIYLRRFERIRTLLTPPDLTGIFDDHLLDDTTMSSLEFCAERLSVGRAGKKPPEDEVEALKGAVDSLKERILSERIDHDLQIILLDLVESMRRALHEYTLNGVEGLRDELFSVLGRLQRYYPVFRQHDNEPVVKEFWDILSRYDTITSLYLNVPQILNGISKLLMAGQ